MAEGRLLLHGLQRLVADVVHVQQGRMEVSADLAREEEPCGARLHLFFEGLRDEIGQLGLIAREARLEVVLDERLEASVGLEPGIDESVELALGLGARRLRTAPDRRAELLVELLEGSTPVEGLKPVNGVTAAREVLALGVERVGVGAQGRNGFMLDEVVQVVEEALGATKAVAQERHEVVRAVQVVREVREERVEVGLPTGRRLVVVAFAEPVARGTKQVDGVDLESSRVGRVLERLAHRQVLERIDDAQGVFLLEARYQRAVGGEVALGRVEVDHEEDAAEEVQEVLELSEHLLKEQVVRLHDEDRARCRVAEVPRHAVVAELHSAVEARRVHEDRAGL